MEPDMLMARITSIIYVFDIFTDMLVQLGHSVKRYIVNIPHFMHIVGSADVDLLEVDVTHL